MDVHRRTWVADIRRALRTRWRLLALLAALAALTVVVGACGGNDEQAAPAEVAGSPAEPEPAPPAAAAEATEPPPAAAEAEEPPPAPAKEPPPEPVEAPAGTISTVAGTGLPGSSGDGGPATDAQFLPASLAVDTAGRLYVTDQPGRVRRVNAKGVIKTVAGTGGTNYTGDGGQATDAEIGIAPDLAADMDGNLYLLQFEDTAVRQVSSDGVISVLVCDPRRSPAAAALDTEGALYIVCQDDNSVVKVDADGSATTVAGTGLPGFAGDGGPAAEAELSLPYGIAIGPDGSVYVGDSGNNRIRKIDSEGVITTVAGTGTAGYSGDGGPAVDAELAFAGGAAGLVVDAEGNLFIADHQNERIRRVGIDGMITTVAGTGTAGYSGDDGPATEAMLDSPIALAVDADGNLYIADAGNYRVRKLTFE